MRPGHDRPGKDVGIVDDEAVALCFNEAGA